MKIFKPRMWQQITLRKFKELGYNALVEAPTAAGKTVFAIMMISILRVKKPGLKTVIVVPTINLLKQWKQELIKFLNIKEGEIGEFYGQKKDSSLNKKFMIYVINSASMDNNLFDQQRINPFDFVIVDEVHHIGAKTHKKLLKIESFKYRLGISATPDREYDSEGTKEIIQYFGNKINVSKNNVEVAPLTTNLIRTTLTNKESKNYTLLKKRLAICLSKLKRLYNINLKNKQFFKKISELSEAGIKEAIEYIGTIRKMESIRFTARNKLKLIKHLAYKDLNQKTIIFCDRINFVEEIYKSFIENYPERKTFLIHSKLKKREQRYQLEKFKRSERGILIAAKIVDEGFDVPDASIGVLISFTKSKRQSIQRDGRILRFMKGKISKKYAIVIKGVDEEDYCRILMKIDQIQPALNGIWMDFEEGQFKFSNEFKSRFRSIYVNNMVKLSEGGIKSNL